MVAEMKPMTDKITAASMPPDAASEAGPETACPNPAPPTKLYKEIKRRFEERMERLQRDEMWDHLPLHDKLDLMEIVWRSVNGQKI
jgi:hypothetical protein